MAIWALGLGAAWLVGFLLLAAWRVMRLNPPAEGPWTWPTWIAIASPVAAALGPLWLLMLVAAWLSGHGVFGSIVFGPLLATALAGVVGVVSSAFGARRA